MNTRPSDPESPREHSASGGEPPRVTLARIPTPLEPVAELLDGATLLLKRDDLTGCALSGNKIRKLEYLLADALAQGATRVLTCGGIQSNHCRATAVAARRLGLDVTLFLRTPAPPTDAPRGNLALDQLLGADIRYVTPEQYQNRAALMAEAAGETGYVIPEGGSNALGSWGYVRAFDEIMAQCTSQRPTAIVCAVGSGGTLAGLMLGARRRGSNIPVIGVNVCDDAPYFQAIVARIADEAHTRWGLPAIAADEVQIHEGYMGRGYALSTDEERADIARVAKQTGHFFDPVYTGKALRALLYEPERFGARPLFVHTGGIFGLLA